MEALPIRSKGCFAGNPSDPGKRYETRKMHAEDHLYGTIKNGVIVLSGFNASVTVRNSCLFIRDGIKGATAEHSFGRAHCPVSRIISTQWGGVISFDAIRWLHGIGASFIH